MKKIFLATLTVFAVLSVSAQNIQVHYDFGKHIYSNEEGTRPDVTLTYETFKADKIGNWFYFIDADIDKNGVAGAYTELSREFNIGQKGFAAHVEFDGGLSRGGSFQSAALFGAAWNGHNADFSTTYSIQAMYKQYFNQENGPDAYPSFQLTGVWSTRFAKDKLTFSGFIDFWRGVQSNGHGQLCIITEPQLWYNITKSVSVGTEIEVSNNFIYNTYNDKTFFINPTLAVKFNL